MLNHTRVALVFEGLDTAAEVFLNDQSVGKSTNMFARYIFDVKSSLQVVLIVSVNVKINYVRDEHQASSLSKLLFLKNSGG